MGKKIEAIRRSIIFFTDDSSKLLTPRFLNSFELTTMQGLMDLVIKMKLTTSALDIVPTHFFKLVFDSVGAWILAIVNKSLLSGSVPASC